MAVAPIRRRRRRPTVAVSSVARPSVRRAFLLAVLAGTAAVAAAADRTAAPVADRRPEDRLPVAGGVPLERSIRHDGRDRRYLVVRPSSFRPGNAAVVLLHGGGQGMRTVLQRGQAPARWRDLAAEHGFVLLVPNGWNVGAADGTGERQTWNDLRPDVGNPISTEDDAGFVVAVLEREQPRLGFDPRSVAVVGSSNGGMMAQRMLIEHPDRFAAGCAFIANLPEVPVPEPELARPVMIMNGDADPLMPWAGGTVGFAGAPVRSTPATIAWWRDRHGLRPEPSVVRPLPDLDPADGTRIVRFAWGGTDGRTAAVVLYRMIDAGHAIPVLAGDGARRLPERLLGVRSRDARGVDLAWAFLAGHLPADGG